MVTQTSVQKPNAVRIGSAKLEIGDTIGSLVNIGAVKNAEYYEKSEKVEVESDNADIIVVGEVKQFGFIECDMQEIDLTNLYSIRGGLDTMTTVAASPIAITDELHVVSSTTGVRLNHKDGDNTEVASITVKDLAGTSCVRNTDFVVYVDSAGYTCIARVAGSTILTNGDTAKVSYSYTPNASVSLTSGGKFAISPKVVRVTNYDANGKPLRFTLYKAYIDDPIAIKFPADQSGDVAMMHLTMKGIRDITRTAGDQLREIYDEQNP